MIKNGFQGVLGWDRAKVRQLRSSLAPPLINIIGVVKAIDDDVMTTVGWATNRNR